MYKKLLVVDDENSCLESMSTALDKYRVITAKSTEEAIIILKNENISLVILDIRLPGINGIDALKIIKNIDNLLPVIMISAFCTINNAIELFKLGASDIFCKPFDFYELESSIQNLILIKQKTSKYKSSLLPLDIESLINSATENALKYNMNLRNSIKEFKKVFIDMISAKHIKKLFKQPYQ